MVQQLHTLPTDMPGVFDPTYKGNMQMICTHAPFICTYLSPLDAVMGSRALTRNDGHFRPIDFRQVDTRHFIEQQGRLSVAVKSTKLHIFTTPCLPLTTNTPSHRFWRLGAGRILTWQLTTPIALRGMLSMAITKFAVAAALALTCVQAFAACDGASNMPAHYIDIVFDTDSSAISPAELSRLSEWSIDLHKRFPIIDTVWLNGLAERTEHDAQQLATRRAESVMSVLDQYSIHGENRALAGKIFKPDKFGQSGRRVEVNVSPGCPNHCCPNLNPVPRTQ